MNLVADDPDAELNEHKALPNPKDPSARGLKEPPLWNDQGFAGGAQFQP